MNLLYRGGYRERFDVINSEIQKLRKQATIIELCFGDTYIAQYCKDHGYRWKGLDINEHFVEAAMRRGFDAQKEDVGTLNHLPKGEMCIMVGSLYHFQNNAETILKRMLACAPVVIISEPVRNLSSQKGVIGWIARRAANAGKGHQQFRFTEDSLMKLLREFAHHQRATIDNVRSLGKDLVIKMTRL